MMLDKKTKQGRVCQSTYASFGSIRSTLVQTVNVATIGISLNNCNRNNSKLTAQGRVLTALTENSNEMPLGGI